MEWINIISKNGFPYQCAKPQVEVYYDLGIIDKTMEKFHH